MTKTLDKRRVGAVHIESGRVLLADPCYPKTQGSTVEHGSLMAIVDLLPGDYDAYVELSDEGSWGIRVAVLAIVRQGSTVAGITHGRHELGVDSGQMMIADLDEVYARWVDHGYEDGNHGMFNYSGACRATEGEVRAGIIGSDSKCAVVSSSGFGDGCYPYEVLLDADGDGIGVAVTFLEEEEEEEDDGSW